MRLSIVFTAAALVLSSCGGSPEPAAIRLLDLFDAATIEGTVAVDPVEPTEWRFDGTGTIPLPDPPDADDATDLGPGELEGQGRALWSFQSITLANARNSLSLGSISRYLSDQSLPESWGRWAPV